MLPVRLPFGIAFFDVEAFHLRSGRSRQLRVRHVIWPEGKRKLITRGIAGAEVMHRKSESPDAHDEGNKQTELEEDLSHAGLSLESNV